MRRVIAVLVFVLLPSVAFAQRHARPGDEIVGQAVLRGALVSELNNLKASTEEACAAIDGEDDPEGKYSCGLLLSGAAAAAAALTGGTNLAADAIASYCAAADLFYGMSMLVQEINDRHAEKFPNGEFLSQIPSDMWLTVTVIDWLTIMALH